MPPDSPLLPTSRPATAPDAALIAALGQEAVVGGALLAALPLDQLAQLVPDAGAPPVPSTTELAALPLSDTGAPLSTSTADTFAALPPAVDQSSLANPLPDAASSAYTGYIPVAVTPSDRKSTRLNSSHRL